MENQKNELVKSLLEKKYKNLKGGQTELCWTVKDLESGICMPDPTPDECGDCCDCGCESPSCSCDGGE